MQEVGPLGRRFFINTRLNVGWSDSERRSAVEEPTVRILDAQTIGGAQKAGGRHSRDVNFASDLDYVRGMHSIRVGTAIDFNSFRSDEADNYLGTYTFESLEAFDAGRPRSYTRRIGEPNVSYRQPAGRCLRAGRHPHPAQPVGDAWRPLRDAEPHQRASSPVREFGATWAPFKNGKTTLRASWGVFYDWLATNTYEQTSASMGSSSARSTSQIRLIRRRRWISRA